MGKTTEWELLSARTNASLTRHWVEAGKHHELSEEVTGTPDEIKRLAAPRKAGEVVEIENIHTKKKFAREVHTVTTHGGKSVV